LIPLGGRHFGTHAIATRRFLCICGIHHVQMGRSDSILAHPETR
jgi:hypothetical protein